VHHTSTTTNHQKHANRKPAPPRLVPALQTQPHHHPPPRRRPTTLRLLSALRATNPSGVLSATLRDGTPIEYPLPENPEDIALAKPKDINDLNAGWETIGDSNEGLFFDEEFGSGKGRGKGKEVVGAGAKQASAAKNVNDCPQGAGLRDGGAVAVRFRLKDEKVRRQRLIDGELDVDEIAREGMGIDDLPWDVVVPTMEETYGDEE
jgi:hypothetical protein